MSIDYDKENSLFHVRRNLPGELSTEKYKEEFLLWLGLIKKHKPRLHLIDERHNHFPIEPQLQQWMNENIFQAALKAGVERIALVTSKDFVAHLSQQQVLDEDQGQKFEYQFFKTIKQAYAWLLNDKKNNT